MAWFEKYAVTGTSGHVAVQSPWYGTETALAMDILYREIDAHAVLADYRCRTGSGRPPV